MVHPFHLNWVDLHLRQPCLKAIYYYKQTNTVFKSNSIVTTSGDDFIIQTEGMNYGMYFLVQLFCSNKCNEKKFQITLSNVMMIVWWNMCKEIIWVLNLLS